MSSEEDRLQKLKKIASGYERQRCLKAQLDFQAKVTPKKTYKSPYTRKADKSPILKPVVKETAESKK